MHTYQIGSHTYELRITKGPIFQGAKEIAGEAIWKERLVLISGAIPIEQREEVLLHELDEAWQFHFPKPSNAEKLSDWNANVSSKSHEDYQRNGGRAALEALQATHDVPAPPDSIDADALLKKYRFPDLGDEQFAVAKRLWQSRGLDPWSEKFHVRIVWSQSQRRESIKLVLNIEALRSRAHASSDYAGIDATEFEYAESEIPAKAIVSIYRMVRGERCRFQAEALWDDYFGKTPIDQLDDVVKTHPHACLARCAEASALRRGFPDEVRDIYAPEELVGQPRRAAKPMPTSASIPAAGEDAPQSSGGMHVRLMTLGYKYEEQRRAVIRLASGEFGDREDGDDVAFYAFVIQLAIKNGPPTKQP